MRSFPFLLILVALFIGFPACASSADAKPDPIAIAQAGVSAAELTIGITLPLLVVQSCDAGPAAKPAWRAARVATAAGVAVFGDESLMVGDANDFIDALASQGVPSWLATTIKGLISTIVTALPFDETTKKVDPYARDSIRRVFTAVESAIGSGLDGCLAAR